MNNEEWMEETQLQQDLQGLTDEMLGELKSLSTYAQRGDSIAVASVAYRVRQFAQRKGMMSIEQTAARIEESARRNNKDQFTSDIQLLDHQWRWYTRRDR